MKKIDEKLLREFYYECIYGIGMPKYDKLDDEQKTILSKTNAYAYFKLAIAIDELKAAIKQMIRWPWI